MKAPHPLLALIGLLLWSDSINAEIIKITSEKQYQKALKEQGRPLLITYSAHWCSTCNHIKMPLEELSYENEFNNVLFAHIDIDQVGSISKEQGIVGVPTFDYVHNGEKKERTVGIKDLDSFKDDVRSALRAHFSVAIHDPQRPLQELDSGSHKQPLSYYDANPEPYQNASNEPPLVLPPAHILHAPTETDAPVEPEVQTAPDTSILVPIPGEPTPPVPLYVETSQPITQQAEKPVTKQTTPAVSETTALTPLTTQSVKPTTLPTQQHQEPAPSAPVKPLSSETSEGSLPVPTAMEKTVHEEQVQTAPTTRAISSAAEQLLQPHEVIATEQHQSAQEMPALQETGFVATIKNIGHSIGDMINSAVEKVKGFFKK